MNYIQMAIHTADWVCRNQYESLPAWSAQRSGPFDMTEDMNAGRFVRNLNINTREIGHLSTNWLTGMTMVGLLMLHEQTGNPAYRNAADKASYYLRSLQNTMETRDDWQGAFNERITANRWCAPRDAVSAAWGLLRLHRVTGEEQLLNRVCLFARWHSRHAFADGFPMMYCFFDGQPHDRRQVSCQAGSAAFYYDLYDLTGDAEHLDTANRILDWFLDHFIATDGEMYIQFDPATGYQGDLTSQPVWSDMHKFNDDFAVIALLNGYARSRQTRYLDAVVKYLKWVQTRRHSNGGFGMYGLSVSSCIVALNMLSAHLATGIPAFKQIGYDALQHLSQSVVTAPQDPQINGGLLGLDVMTPASDVICLRVTQYAIYTFLLFGLYESAYVNNGGKAIPDALLSNPMLVGLRLHDERHRYSA